MGWVQEIIDLFGKLIFYEIVHEYEQGLYLRNGRVIDKKVRLHGQELEEIITEERKVAGENGGRFILAARQFIGPEIIYPNDWKKSFLGFPKHPKRKKKDKVLRTGVYFHIPLIERIHVDSQQEKVLNLGNICVPTIEDESKVVLVSCNIRYQLLRLDKAYTAVHDYEASLKDYTLAILAKHSRGKKYSDWKNHDFIEGLEEEVKKELRELVTDKWGLKIHDVYVTDNVVCNYQRMAYEGNLPGIQKIELNPQ